MDCSFLDHYKFSDPIETLTVSKKRTEKITILNFQFSKRVPERVNIYYLNHGETASVTICRFYCIKYDFSKLDDSGNCIIRNTCCIVFHLKRNVD